MRSLMLSFGSLSVGCAFHLSRTSIDSGTTCRTRSNYSARSDARERNDLHHRFILILCVRLCPLLLSEHLPDRILLLIISLPLIPPSSSLDSTSRTCHLSGLFDSRSSDFRSSSGILVASLSTRRRECPCDPRREQDRYERRGGDE
jgi:hypothetical protein